MKYICNKCGRKTQAIFKNHIYNGSESILHGDESIMNGSEHILTGHNKVVSDVTCPFCGARYKQVRLIN